MRDVVGRQPPPPRWVRAVQIVWLVQLAFWVATLVLGDGGAELIVVVLVSLLAVLMIAQLAVDRHAQLVLTDDELRVERRRRPLTIPRDDIRAVRGNIPHRPTWSDHVVVERSGGEVQLPRYDVPAGGLIPRLQEWAGVGERPGSPAD